MADEFVFESQRVEHAGLAEHDRVLERSAERKAALSQHLDFFQKTERPRRRDLIDKRPLVEIERLLLMTKQRMIEADRVADLEAIRRVQLDALVALLQLNLAKNLNRLARRRQLANARVLN